MPRRRLIRLENRGVLPCLESLIAPRSAPRSRIFLNDTGKFRRGDPLGDVPHGPEKLPDTPIRMRSILI